MIPNKNFRFSEFLELFKNFSRGLTNYFFKCTGANFQPIAPAACSFDSDEPHYYPSVFASH